MMMMREGGLNFDDNFFGTNNATTSGNKTFLTLCFEKGVTLSQYS